MDIASAERYLGQAVEIVSRTATIDTLDAALCIHNLGSLRVFQCRYADAVMYLTDALALLRSLGGAGHRHLSTVHASLGDCYRLGGRFSFRAAKRHYEQALEIAGRSLGLRHPALAMLHHRLGLWHFTKRRYPEAEGAFTRALDILNNVFPSGHPHTADVLLNLARLRLITGDPARAEQHAVGALALRRHYFGDKHPKVALALYLCAHAVALQGQTDRAEACFDEMAVIWAVTPHLDRREAAPTLADYAEFLRKAGRAEQAQTIEQQAHLVRE